jgi:hypothetical protein
MAPRHQVLSKKQWRFLQCAYDCPHFPVTAVEQVQITRASYKVSKHQYSELTCTYPPITDPDEHSDLVCLKMAVFWEVAPCSLLEVYQRVRGPCCFHHQGELGNFLMLGWYADHYSLNQTCQTSSPLRCFILPDSVLELYTTRDPKCTNFNKF